MLTHNQKIYLSEIRMWIPDIEEDDLKFLCNRAANIYRSLNDRCVDNFRVSRIAEDGKVNPLYMQAYRRGCCGFIDQKEVNPATGNAFKVGFNFGH